MKKIIFVTCCACLLFTYCSNNDPQRITDGSQQPPPDTEKVKIRYKDTIPLKDAEQYIKAFRDGGTSLFTALAQGKHGVMYKAEHIVNFSTAFLEKFAATHQKATKQGYDWQVGTAFAVKKSGTTETMNFLVYPVLASKTTSKILDYFELKRMNSPDVKFYLRDDVVHTIDPQYPDSSFVFDEGALWP